MTLQVQWAGADRRLQAAQEIVLLALVSAAPWAFGAEEPAFQGLLLAGIAAIAFLGGVRVLLSGGADSWNCPVALALAALILLSGLQLLPLPPAWLQAVSPASQELAAKLLPDRHESFVGASAESPILEYWRPISLNPPGTRWFLIQLLALLLVAIIVRGQLAGPGFFHRLRWAVFLNGSALSLFALAQAASSPSHMVYWTFATDGSVFGPFICRNHFPFYLSLCIGLSIGLLRNNSQSSPLQDPGRLWILCGLALMGVACLFSLSRGGIAAMAISALIVGVIARRHIIQMRSLALPALGLSLAAMLAAWLGTRSVESRLATIEQPGAGLSERLAIWRSVLPHLARFPLLGSGNGTFALLEPSYRTEGREGDFPIAEFAHNEYLEAAFEGGIARFAVTAILPIAIVIIMARAIRGDVEPHNRMALLGGLWGVLTIAIHSAVDFGMHMPAIALLGVVAATELLALASPGPRDRGEATIGSRWLMGFLAIALSILLANEGVSTFAAAHYHREAAALSESSDDSDHDRQFDYWESALLWRPRDAELQQSAGQAYLRRFNELQLRDQRFDRLWQVSQCVLFTSPDLAGAANLVAGLSGRFPNPSNPARAETSRQRLLAPAAKHLIAARDLCPLLAETQYQLAAVGACLNDADSPEAYLRRAALLRPTDPAIWFSLGRQCLDDGDHEQAISAWKRCLELSDRYLQRILSDSHGVISPDQIRARLLPLRPETWLAAADLLAPESDAAERRLFLEPALKLLEARGAGDAEWTHRKAVVQRELQLFAEAEASYRLALRQSPGRQDWRLELARLLRRLHRPTDARLELEIILNQEPGHREASELVPAVTREAQLLGVPKNS